MAQSAAHNSGHGKQSIILQPHFVLELADYAQDKLDKIDKATSQIVKSSAIRAFRVTVVGSASHIPHPALNAAGNLRAWFCPSSIG